MTKFMKDEHLQGGRSVNNGGEAGRGPVGPGMASGMTRTRYTAAMVGGDTEDMAAVRAGVLR